MNPDTLPAPVTIYGDALRTTIELHGSLDIHNSKIVWNQCQKHLTTLSPETLIINAKGLTNCDSAGIHLINDLKQFQVSRLKHCHIIHLAPQLIKNFEIFTQESTMTSRASTPEKESWFVQIGREIMTMGKWFKDNLTFTGELVYYFVVTLFHPRRMRWRDTWRLIEATGPNALPIVALLGFLIGMIMGFQGAVALEKFGAKMYVPNFVGITLLRELAPLLSAIILIGRSASSFAAELGSMKMNQEIDALRTMGIEIIQFLAIPRVVAAMLMLPILNVFMILFGLIGCSVVTRSLGMSFQLYLTQLSSALTLQDFLGGVFKSFIFGIVVAAIGCMHGLRTRGGASGVGRSTTQTVVSGIVMLTIIDGIFSVVFFSLKL